MLLMMVLLRRFLMIQRERVVDEQWQLAILRFLIIIHQLLLGMGMHLGKLMGLWLLVLVLKCSFRFRHSSNQLRMRLERLLGYILRFRLIPYCLGIMGIQLFMENLMSMGHILLIRRIPIHLHS